MLESWESLVKGSSMAQSWGRLTDFQSESSKRSVETGPKPPVLEKLPRKLKSRAGSVAWPRWKRQPKSRRSRSRPAADAAALAGEAAGPACAGA